MCLLRFLSACSLFLLVWRLSLRMSTNLDVYIRLAGFLLAQVCWHLTLNPCQIRARKPVSVWPSRLISCDLSAQALKVDTTSGCSQEASQSPMPFPFAVQAHMPSRLFYMQTGTPRRRPEHAVSAATQYSLVPSAVSTMPVLASSTSRSCASMARVMACAQTRPPHHPVHRRAGAAVK